MSTTPRASTPTGPSAMTRTERVRAAVAGDPVDRIPVCFWHHFQPSGSGRALADASFQFFSQTHDLDIMKVMPDIPYPFPKHAVADPEQWRLLEPIDPSRSRFFQQRAEAVRVLRERLGNDMPIVMTVFSPLCEAIHFAAGTETLLDHMRGHSGVVHEALSVIAENLREHIRHVIAAGADGVFFALQGCTTAIMPAELYREFGRPYDLLALQGAADGWLNILHVHGERDLLFNDVLDYPVQVLSWSDRIAGPSLREARGMTSKCLMGGWNEFGALANGPEETIAEEARDAIRQTAGRRFILANGCSVPDETDEQWLRAARSIVPTLEVG